MNIKLSSGDLEYNRVLLSHNLSNTNSYSLASYPEGCDELYELFFNNVTLELDLLDLRNVNSMYVNDFEKAFLNARYELKNTEYEIYRRNCNKEHEQIIKKYKYGYYLYRFIDESNNIIYIGKTNRLLKRLIKEHFTEKGHLSQECYDKVVRIEILRLNSDSDMHTAELYFINKFKPEYNNKDKGKGELSFSIPYFDEMSWELFEKPTPEEMPMTTFFNQWEECHPFKIVR